LVVLITTVFKVAPMLASPWVTLWPEWNTVTSAVRSTIYRLDLLHYSLCFLKTAVTPSTVSLLRHPWLIVPCSAPEMAPSFVVVETALTCTAIPVPTKVLPPQALCRQQTFLEIGSIRDAWRTYTLHF